METKPPIFQNPQMDGSSFYWEGKPNNKVGILLFHGFTATTVEVRPVAKFLNIQGYTVMGPLLPGHGVSPQDLNRVTYLDWVRAGENALIELKIKHEKVFVLGESMGGLLSLWLSAVYPDFIRGLLLFAPALKIPGLWKSNIFWPFVESKLKNNIDLSSPWQGFNVVPLRAASQLNRFQLQVLKKLPMVTTPMIIFQGKLDKTIDSSSSVEVLERAGSKSKQLVWLEESSHCILLDKQLAEAQTISLDFIKKLGG